MKDTKPTDVHPQFAFTKGPKEYEMLKNATLSYQGAYIMGSLKTPKLPWLPRNSYVPSTGKALVSPYSRDLWHGGAQRQKRFGSPEKRSYLAKSISLPPLRSNSKAR